MAASVVALLTAVTLGGCQSSPARTAPASDSSAAAAAAVGTGAASGELTVLAASSLTKVFTELGTRFEVAHPGTIVRFSFAGSADLVAQLQQGAPGDVLATADTAAMERAAADGLLAGTAQPFATNTLAIAVPAGNPAGIASFADLARPGVSVVVCAPQVPCGAATARVEARAGVTLSPVSEEGSVTAVLGKVASGEADAGVVYATDVVGATSAAAGGATPPPVEAIPIPAAVNATNTYPIAVLSVSAHPALAADFRDLVVSSQGQQVLADAGFGGR